MLLTYDEFFDRMTIEVRQAKETGDFSVDDEFRLFPKEEGKSILNDVMEQLAIYNKPKFTKRITQTFQSDTTKYTLPANYREMISFRDGDGLQWDHASHPTDRFASIYAIDEDSIIKESGWSKGDEIELYVVRNPDRIENDNDYIDKAFRNHIQLLKLSCKEIAFSQAGKDMMGLDIRKLGELKAIWQADVKKIRTKAFFSYGAKRYGYRR